MAEGERRLARDKGVLECDLECVCSSQVKVVELKVIWITKSYSPQGSDSVCPPPSSITQENLCRLVGHVTAGVLDPASSVTLCCAARL